MWASETIKRVAKEIYAELSHVSLAWKGKAPRVSPKCTLCASLKAALIDIFILTIDEMITRSKEGNDQSLARRFSQVGALFDSPDALINHNRKQALVFEWKRFNRPTVWYLLHSLNCHKHDSKWKPVLLCVCMCPQKWEKIRGRTKQNRKIWTCFKNVHGIPLCCDISGKIGWHHHCHFESFYINS